MTLWPKGTFLLGHPYARIFLGVPKRTKNDSISKTLASQRPTQF